MTDLHVADQSHSIRGHWRLDVYEGDIVRERLPWRKRAWNLYADLRWKLLGVMADRYYRGAVVNAHVQTIEGTNLVTTAGKGLIMDRLYGLSAVSAVSRTGVGTSATAAAVVNTSLTGGVFKAFDSTPVRSALTVTSITTFGTGDANISWNELGQDNATTLLNRIAPIGPFNKTTAVSIIVTHALTQS